VWQAAAPGVIITDVGSTKAAIVAAAHRLATTRPLTFVGSHPMAGSEKSGYGVARADLFQGATVIVTPTDASEPRAVKTVMAFWESLGAVSVVTLDPETHDRAVAAISHLPHLVACALVEAVERFDPAAFDVAARGFKDTTRIAAGDVNMWEEIFLGNREAVVRATAAAQAALAELARLVETGDRAGLHQALTRIKARRERLS
jgi:prephenate dehydrogenase